MNSEGSQAAKLSATWVQSSLTAIAVAAMLFTFVFVLGTSYSSADDAIELLYVVPIAVIGFEFGVRGAFLAAAVALGLIGASAALGAPEVDSLGLATRAAAILWVAVLAGLFGQRLRTQARLRSELERTRGQAADQFRNALSFLDHHEAERGEIAHQLHEQTAQTLAAALMALSLLEHDAGETRLDRSQVEAIRSHMRECLEELRGLAESLRPAVLSDLGLAAALERVCVREGECTGRPIAFHVGDGVEGFSPGVEAIAYRTAQEMLRSLNDATDVWVAFDDDVHVLHMAVASGSGDQGLSEALAPTKARLQILGGSIRISTPPREIGSGLRLEAEIPLLTGTA